MNSHDHQIAPFEALGIVAICFGWFILSSLQSVLSGFANTAFSDNSFGALIALELILGAVALAVLYARRYVLASLYPSPSWRGAGAGILLYLVAAWAAWLTVAPFASSLAAQPVGQLLAHATVSLRTVVPLAIVNGAYEEVFLLGFLVRGLRRFGASNAIGVSLLVRLLYHMYQGPLGALSVLVFGGVLSIFYWRKGQLFPVVFAHVLADIVPFL